MARDIGEVREISRTHVFIVLCRKGIKWNLGIHKINKYFLWFKGYNLKNRKKNKRSWIEWVINLKNKFSCWNNREINSLKLLPGYAK